MTTGNVLLARQRRWYNITDMGDTLRNLRKQAGLSQEELAVLAGVSHSTIVKYEGGQVTNPTVNNLRAIADALTPFFPPTDNKILSLLLGEAAPA